MVSKSSMELEGAHLSPIRSTSSVIIKSFGRALKGFAHDLFVPPTEDTKASAMLKRSKLPHKH